MIYVPPRGPNPARILIVGESPGAEEEINHRPFCGPAGRELESELHDAGIPASECFFTNVSRFRPPNNEISAFIWNPADHKKKDSPPSGLVPYKDRFVAPFILEHIEHLRKEIAYVNPNVVVPVGNTALWALSGLDSVAKWRGSELLIPNMERTGGLAYKLLPTYHPAYILRQYRDRNYAVEDFKRARRESESPCLSVPAYDFVIRPTFRDTIDLLRMLKSRLDRGQMRIVCDLETRRMRFIACLGLGWSKTEALCIPFMCMERPTGYWSSTEEELAVILAVSEVLLHPNAIITGQNYNYDQQYTHDHWGLKAFLAHDTMIGWHTCFPGTEKRLDILASLLCEHYVFWKEESKEWGSEGEDTLWAYNCKDCVYTYEIAEEELRMLAALGMQKQFDFQMRVNREALNMMLRGCRRDAAAVVQLHEEVSAMLKERDEYLTFVLGHPLNPGSNGPGGQMQRLFYEDFALKPIKARGTDRPTLNGDALETLAERQPLIRPLVQVIEDIRTLKLIKGMYLEAQPSPDGRMRSNFNSGGAETYRWSSSKDAFGRGANLQNVTTGSESRIALYCRKHGPTATQQLLEAFAPTDWNLLSESQRDEVRAQLTKELDAAEDTGTVTVTTRGKETLVTYRLLKPNIRKVFIPDPGYMFSDWDLDRADLQVVVWEADDAVLKQMLRENVDIHTENAKLLGATRGIGKRFVHLTDYGGKPAGAARKLGLPVAKVDWMQKRWFAAHPGIKAWHVRTMEGLHHSHSVSNVFGYRRFYFDRPESCFTEALAWTPQSTVALVISHGLLNIADNLQQVQLLLQVHDSLDMQHPIELHPGILPRIRKELSIVVPYPDPLIIPVSCKASLVSWGDCKEIKIGAE